MCAIRKYTNYLRKSLLIPRFYSNKLPRWGILQIICLKQSKIATIKQPWLYDTLTITKTFSTIYANTPWQVLHSPPRICQRGLAGFPLAPVQRAYNERVRAYTITFLPPGRFLYFHLYLLFN